MWNHADKPFTIPWDLYCVTHVHCQMILEDQTLFQQLNNSSFDLAIVDLIANECSLALARALGLPVATFWGFAYQGGEVRDFRPAFIVSLSLILPWDLRIAVAF